MRAVVSLAGFARAGMVCAALWCALASGAARAESARDDRIGVLWQAMRMERMIGIMRREGLRHGRALAEDMLPGGGSGHLRDRAEAIHDPERMARKVRARFAAGLDGIDPAPLVAFFTSAEGREIIELEFAARLAMLDPDAEEAARARYRALAATPAEDSRLAATRDFVTANDLVERNVTAALNSNLGFMFGLIEGDALGMSRSQAIRNVSASADEIRQSTAEWVYSYVMLAQDPLSVAQIRDYTALAASPEGRAMNAALFDAFGAMYRQLSHAMGLALAAEMAASDI